VQARNDRPARGTLTSVPGFLVVITATGSRDSAVELLRSAVGARLAAGGQVCGPAVSAYWHQDQYGESEEWQVLLRTAADRYQELQAHLVERHPWQNPEVIAVAIADGSHPYLEWISRVASPA